ncbi:beta-galactosidase [Catenulispora sp. NF23]|uniref:glycoside hydrolase family 35 protein n=1 Tax=Catenulispora pinistramenti TaxID=2705254 RepID=UPI001BAD1C34|nr:beta-galactosidase family protein [Catenulispora pinistramenti]MBS2537428.1 beta-galactosidase [Catenulispora pinistramenti]
MAVLDITDDGFALDGQPFRIIAGGLHYFRVHPAQWSDRLRKARLMGLNAIDTYVPWNLHERRRGTFDFSGILDLAAFLDQAAAEGLHVLLRPGPYICGEWEGGGLPSWLLAEPGLALRSTDPAFLEAVEAYLDALLPIVLPRLGTRGGPIIAVQVENEYGAYGSDTAYMERLYEALTSRGIDVPLFTSDQPGDLAAGALPGVLATANFGSKATASLAALRAQQPTGPLMCTEFWNGWFDAWGGVHALRPAEDAGAALDEILQAGASVSFYMFHGGTNFGFLNGANDKGAYRATVTSYDYDAPLDEAGEVTEKYRRFRSVIGKYEALPEEEIPEAGPKLPPVAVELRERAPLFAPASLAALGTAQTADSPLTMERLGQDFGFVLYEARLPAAGPVTLAFEQIADRAQVFVDGQPVGVLERERHEHVVSLVVPGAGAELRVLVENQGRVNYGVKLADRKGLIGSVYADDAVLTGWSSRPLPLDELSGLEFGAADGTAVGPCFHRGVFRVERAADTYLHLDGWTKGVAWVNGFNLGRYWSRGPQGSLYVPGPVLREGENEVVVLELHGSRTMTVELRPVPNLGPTEL